MELSAESNFCPSQTKFLDPPLATADVTEEEEGGVRAGSALVK